MQTKRERIPELVSELYFSGDDTDEILKDLLSSYVSLVKLRSSESDYLVESRALTLMAHFIDLI